MRSTEPFNIELQREKMAQRKFEYMAHAFFEKWQPKEPDEAARFSAELFSLVRQIHMDAAEPLTQQLVHVLRSMSMPMKL